jgi:nickel transport protein
MNLLKLIAVLVMAAGIAPLVHAHGIWFAQRSGELALIYGHGADDQALRQSH